MKNKIINIALSVFMLVSYTSCSDPDYEFGDLAAPSNIQLNAEIVGADEENPYGDGSGEVIFTLSADDAISYKIDYGTTAKPDFVTFKGQGSKKYTKTGLNKYTISIIAYGRGGIATNFTQEIEVQSDYTPSPELINMVVGDNGSKTWVVDASVSGHFGVGPAIYGLDPDEGKVFGPGWWSAPPNAKDEEAPCLYSSSFTFTQVSGEVFTLDVDAPGGAFTKTGEFTTLPGIPDSGAEGCYTEYTGGTSEFTFGPSTSTIMTEENSTRNSINLIGTETFIGYGATSKEYEILEITPDFMHLRVRGYGGEINNAWYVKLIPAE